MKIDGFFDYMEILETPGDLTSQTHGLSIEGWNFISVRTIAKSRASPRKTYCKDTNQDEASSDY